MKEQPTNKITSIFHFFIKDFTMQYQEQNQREEKEQEQDPYSITITITRLEEKIISSEFWPTIEICLNP